MVTIFLTGATGSIGKSILPILASTHNVVALGHQKKGLAHPRVKWVAGDIRRPETYIQSLAACNVLIHLAANVSNVSPDLQQTNVHATRDLVLSARQSGCEKIIIFSSAAVTQEFLTPYSQSKKEMENELKKMNIPLFVVRPTLVYRRGSTYLKGMAQYLQLPLPFVPLPNSGNADLRPIHADDVGAALLCMLAGPNPVRFTAYDWATEKSMTLRDVLELMARQKNIHKPFVGFPHRMMGRLFEWSSSLGVHLPLRFIQLAAQGSSYRVNPSPFAKEYHFHFRDPVEGLRECV